MCIRVGRASCCTSNLGSCASATSILGEAQGRDVMQQIETRTCLFYIYLCVSPKSFVGEPMEQHSKLRHGRGFFVVGVVHVCLTIALLVSPSERLCQSTR